MMGEIVSALEGKIRVSRALAFPLNKISFLFEVTGSGVGELLPSAMERTHRSHGRSAS